MLVQEEFLRTADCRYSSKGNFYKRRIAVDCQNGISVSGIPPFLVRTEFWQSAKCRCLSKGNFGQRQTAVHHPNRIFSNGRPPLLVQEEFPRPADCRCSSKRNFRERHSAVTCPSRISANGKMPFLVQRQVFCRIPTSSRTAAQCQARQAASSPRPKARNPTRQNFLQCAPRCRCREWRCSPTASASAR